MAYTLNLGGRDEFLPPCNNQDDVSAVVHHTRLCTAATLKFRNVSTVFLVTLARGPYDGGERCPHTTGYRTWGCQHYTWCSKDALCRATS